MSTKAVSTPPRQKSPWHNISAERALKELSSSLAGLTELEAGRRLANYGRNMLPEMRSKSVVELLLQQVRNPIIVVLIAAAGIAFLTDPIDGVKNCIVVLAVVFINTIVGFFQEYKAERAIKAIAQLIPQQVSVIRNGVKIPVEASEVTPGDVVWLASGDKVPADLRLVSVKNLSVQEAALTGESLPVEKFVEELELEAPLADRKNMAYAGTLVTYGSGLGVVVETGTRTELGNINRMLQEAISLETPLTTSLRNIGSVITQAVCLLSALILTVGTVRTVLMTDKGWLQSFLDTLTFAVALAVAAIPEGLPAVVTIALAIGVQRMASRRAVVKRLPAVETLGSTTVICTDKTGTLTRNEMTVCELWIPASGQISVTGVGYEPKGDFVHRGATVSPSREVSNLLAAAALCSDAELICSEQSYTIAGDPTEGALVVAAEKAGISVRKLRAEMPRIDSIPFESENQYMATLHMRRENVREVLVKGAPEVILARCSDELREAGLQQAALMACVGMRVLAVACKDVNESFVLTHHELTRDFELLGLIAMIDPPRPEALSAIETCRRAGITVKMITGDHPATAQAIGEKLGLVATSIEERSRPVLTGAELSEMSDGELICASSSYNVFARVAPEHKLRLVRALQMQQNVVAMTGDGVNDAPALKQADIGIAMGISGTSASKEAASIVLTDDNFATIAAAVEEGRRVYDNLVKSLTFILPTNVGLALIFVVAVAFFPFDPATRELLLPMNPAQLLWINLVATVALALPLAFEAKERDIMDRVPRKLNAPILSRVLLTRTIATAVVITITAIAGFLFEYSQHENSMASLGKAQTFAVTTVIFCQILYVLQCRSLSGVLSIKSIAKNPYVNVGIVVLLILQVFFVYSSPFQTAFNTADLSGTEIILSALLAGSVVVARYIEGYLRSSADILEKYGPN